MIKQVSLDGKYLTSQDQNQSLVFPCNKNVYIYWDINKGTDQTSYSFVLFCFLQGN